MFKNQSLKLYEQSPDRFSIELCSDIYFLFKFNRFVRLKYLLMNIYTYMNMLDKYFELQNIFQD